MADKECSRFWVFISGAIVGATLGILFAPDSGKNTRAKIKAKLKELASKLEQLKDEKKTIKSAGGDTSGLREEDYIKAEKLLKEIEDLYKNLAN